MTITGGCLCGAVRYSSTAEPIITRMCWCRVCQYFAAGNATVNVCFPSEAISISGELRDYPSTADSGNAMHRRFCPRCGTHMLSESESRPQLIFIRAGTLDDATIAKPAANIWTSSAPAWACMNTSLTAFEGQPPPPSAR
ncbi:MAG TPA: GFA family protein [Steroidobacteraceae bacterium]|nr:GFA family protein [Steroidobacteraceae bacterium]